MNKTPENFENGKRIEELSRELPFTVPANYFEQLPETVMSQIKAIPDEHSTAPVQPFGVPEGYFDTLHAAVQDRISGKEKTGVSFRPEFWRSYRPQFAMTLATFLVIFVVLFRSSTRVISVPETDTYMISVEELSQSYMMDDIDEELIADVMTSSSEIENNNDEKISEFLIDNNIDLSQIEIEL